MTNHEYILGECKKAHYGQWEEVAILMLCNYKKSCEEEIAPDNQKKLTETCTYLYNYEKKEIRGLRNGKRALSKSFESAEKYSRRTRL